MRWLVNRANPREDGAVSERCHAITHSGAHHNARRVQGCRREAYAPCRALP